MTAIHLDGNLDKAGRWGGRGRQREGLDEGENNKNEVTKYYEA